MSVETFPSSLPLWPTLFLTLDLPRWGLHYIIASDEKSQHLSITWASFPAMLWLRHFWSRVGRWDWSWQNGRLGPYSRWASKAAWTPAHKWRPLDSICRMMTLRGPWGWCFLYRGSPVPGSPSLDHRNLASFKLALHSCQFISFGHPLVRVC